MPSDPAHASIKLTPGEVHIWEIPLVATDPVVAACSALLNAEEQARAARLRIPEHGRRWTLARAALRDILACYTGTEPEALVFHSNAHGKPALAGENNPPIHFNLSHSKDLALLAVALQEVGVDTEYINPKTDWVPLAKRVLSEREYAQLMGCEPQSQRRMFFQLWAAKEAYMKGRGLGFSLPLKSFSMPVSLAENAGPVIADAEWDDGKPWKIYTLTPRQDTHAASLAYVEIIAERRWFLWSGTASPNILD
jgi:4'-phosphopantetheinyl transferase